MRYKAIAEFYDVENARHEMLRHDVPFFLEQLPRRKRFSILELAAGTGRAAIPIAQAGHRVVGTDYDQAMLDIAVHKRDAVGLKERELSLLHGDLLDLDLGRRFDWVCVFFNTFLAFTTLDEQDRALQAMLRHMRPNGRLWLDIFYPDHARLAPALTLDVDPCAFFVPQFDRTVFMKTEIRRGKQPQTQRVTFRYSWFDADGEERRRKTEFDLTWLFPRELQLLLERNGLKIEESFGNYDGSPVGPDSPRIIVRCCRK